MCVFLFLFFFAVFFLLFFRCFFLILMHFLFLIFISFLVCMCSDVYYDGGSIGSRLLCDDTPMTKTKDFSQFFDPSSYHCRPATSNLPYVQQIQLAADSSGEHTTMANSTREVVVSAKKYTFNPLSEPFHPMRSISSPASVFTNSSECSPIACTEIASATTKTGHSEPVNTNKFVCILCPEKYDTLAELKNHLKNKVQQPHTCVICGMSFGHNYLLHRHMKQHRSLKVFRCRGCNKKFRSFNMLMKHFEFCPYKLYMFI